MGNTIIDITPTQTSPLSPNTVVVGTADFNGDGKADILFRSPITGAVNAYLSTVVTSLAPTGYTPTAVTGSNLNPNLVACGIGNFNGVPGSILFQNISTGQPSYNPFVTNGVGFNPTLIGSNDNPAWTIVGTGDFNGDGNTDILWRNSGANSAEVWTLNSKGAVSSSAVFNVPAGVSTIGSGNFKGQVAVDGWFYARINNQMIWNWDPPSVNPNTTTTVPSGYTPIGSGDFNGDGKADMLLQNTIGQAGVLLNTSSGASCIFLTPTSVINSNNGPGWTVVGTGDFNGDGIGDLLWQNTNGHIGQTLTSLTNFTAQFSGSFNQYGLIKLTPNSVQFTDSVANRDGTGTISNFPLGQFTDKLIDLYNPSNNVINTFSSGATSVTGTGANDSIFLSPSIQSASGGDGNDAFYPGGGTNTSLDGGAGNNTVVYSGTVVQYSITASGSNIIVADKVSGRDGTDKLTNIQYLQFSDHTINLTSIPAVAVEATMYGATGTSAEITSLTNNFLPAQVANATANGLNPLVYACEAVGLVFAFGNENGSTAFSNNFGPSNNTMPNTTAGDAAFAAAASSTIFGSASTANLVNVMGGFVSFWKGFFTANGVSGYATPTAAQIDLAARGTAWGDMDGVALANTLGLLNGQVINFLQDAALGTAVYGGSLTSQPTAGAAAASAASDLATPVTVAGIATGVETVHLV